MTKSSILVNLNDPRTPIIGEIISNKTARKILGLLAEQELSESELSNLLKIPFNTLGYNIKKLETAGLIEKTQKFLWSIKGKRIHKYKISSKKIIISPKSTIQGIIPAIILSIILALGIKAFTNIEKTPAKIKDSIDIAGGAAEAMKISTPLIENPVYTAALDAWAWFLLGSLTALLIFILFNYLLYKNERRLNKDGY